MPTWDRCFIIDGITITGIPFPHERIAIDDNMILMRIEGKPEQCSVHIKVKTKEGEDFPSSEANKAAQERILDFVSVFTLKTIHEPTITDAGASTMQDSNRLGDFRGGLLRGTVRYAVESEKRHMERESKTLAEAIDFFKSAENLIQDNPWLRNALRYFYFARTSDRLEDKLINMFISLESLFSGEAERSESRYRLSLRTATLVGSVSDKKRPEVFDDIKGLYDKRSAVVHGGNESHL